MLYPMVSAGALNSLFFGVYGVSLRGMMYLRANAEKPTYLEIYLAGCAGGLAQLVIACPIDLVKIKLQTQTGRIYRMTASFVCLYFCTEWHQT